MFSNNIEKKKKYKYPLGTGLKTSLLIIFLLNQFYAQNIQVEHLNGPMGGYTGGLAITEDGTIYSGVYSAERKYAGFFKSTDNGNNWEKVETGFEDLQVYSIFISEEGHIWIGTNFQGRIYRSTDNGVTWENKRNGYDTPECWAFGKSSDGVLFAGDGQYFELYRSTDNGDNWEFSENLRPLTFASDTGGVVFAGTHDGLFITTDNGISWGQNNFLKDIPVASMLIDNEHNIYCGTGYYDKGDGIFRSTDGGVSWDRIGLENKVVLSLDFDSEGNIFAGTIKDGVFKTTDQGNTWQQFQNGLYHKQVFRLKLRDDNNIFIGSENEGVFRSTDGGENFTQIGLPVSNAKDIKFYGDSLLFASTPSGVQKYNTVTQRWTNIGLQDVYGIDVTETGNIFAATFADGLFKSTDLGESWAKTSLFGDTLMSTYNVVVKNEDTVLVATEAYLRKSTDAGDTWSKLPINTSFFDRGMFLTEKDFWVTGFGNTQNIIYRSTDLVNFDSTFGYGYNWSENNCLYVLESGKVFFTDTYRGTFFSPDTGNNWSQILPIHKVWSIYAEENGLVIGGASDTLWVSKDFGENWQTYMLPLPEGDNVNDIKKSPEGTMYYATYCSGAYKFNLITDVKSDGDIIKNDFALYQNYPNPFNPKSVIKYNIKNTGLVTIKVYNLLGQKIVELVNEIKPPGEYEIIFDGTRLASGVYIYQMQAGEFTSSKKMVLIK